MHHNCHEKLQWLAFATTFIAFLTFMVGFHVGLAFRSRSSMPANIATVDTNVNPK